MNKKEKEALRRLELLKDNGLLEDVVEEYRDNKQLYFSESNGLFPVLYYIDSAPSIVLEKIESLTKDGAVVYHVTHEYFEFGECWDLLLITDEDVSNDYGEGSREDFDNYGIQFAYVINTDVPEFSEFGSIQIQTRAGGIKRTA